MVVGTFAGLGCAVLFVAASPLFFGLALAANSERTVYERVNSPGGWKQARVQFDDCGAACSFHRVVFVRSRLLPLDSPLLSCRAFLANGEAAVKLSWLNDSTLMIQHHFNPKNVEDVATHCGSVAIVAKAIQPFEAYGNA
jgi:hypothetical protein